MRMMKNLGATAFALTMVCAGSSFAGVVTYTSEASWIRCDLG